MGIRRQAPGRSLAVHRLFCCANACGEVGMRTILGTALGAALSVAMGGLALGADLPASSYYSAPAPLSAYSWIGPYIGANLGYEWGQVSNNPTRPSGLAGGIEGGYNWQFGQFVAGAEADLQVSGADDTFAPWQFSNPWFGTVRGRAGVAIGNALIFGTAGLAYGGLTVQTPGNLSQTRDSIGWVAGGGLEVGFTPHWSAKAEWLYLDLADRSYSLTSANNGLAANLLRLGLNYHF
jgi:outer membrane immunogenic protein